MKRNSLLFLTAIVLLLRFPATAQQPTVTTALGHYFTEAYTAYPDLPRGILEATAYAASHMQNLDEKNAEPADCMGMPQRYGLFGLTENGKGYFKNNLVEVCALSNITPEQFKSDLRLQVLAVAKYLNQQAGIQKKARASAEDFAGVLETLSEIPADGSTVNAYARALYTYDIYTHLQKGFTTPAIKTAPANIQLKKIYPEATLRLLQSPGIMLNYKKDKITSPGGGDLSPAAGTTTVQSSHTANGTMGVLSADYPPAIWNAAATCNYGAGRGGAAVTHVGIHTTQGSYAGTISWFKNCSAGVSAHYVIRSSDGQVTQMVSEYDMAWHIGNNNSYTIGIEHEGYVADASWYTEAMYQSSAALVRDICDSWGIDRNSVFRGPATSTYNPITNAIHVKGHQHYDHPSHHTDPGVNWNWGKYADLIKPYIIVPNGTYRITNVGSGRVLDAIGCSGDNATGMNIWDWWGGDCQRWSFEHMGDGWYKISCRLGGRVLDNLNCAGTDGNRIQLFDWLNNDCQRWRIEDWGGGQVRLVNKASGKLLDVANGATANGTQVWQWGSNGTNAQRWTLQLVSANYIANGTYRIRLVKNNRVLQPGSGTDSRGTAMAQWDWLDSSYQKWKIENTADGWYKFTTPNGFALDLENCNNVDGGKVMLWDWLDNDCQRWCLTAVDNGVWNISSKASVKALDAPGSENGGVVYQWTWVNNGNQQWYIETPPAPLAKQAVTPGQLTVAPNPVTAGAPIQLMYHSDEAQAGTIAITDIYGRPVQQQKVTIQKGYNLFVVPSNAMRPGVYNTTILPNNHRRVEIKKIIIIK